VEKWYQGKIWIDELGWWRTKSSYSHRVGCRKSILTGLEHFKSLVHFKAKDGSMVSFWHDVWCGYQPLKTQFPDLFRCSFKVCQGTRSSLLEWRQNLTFVRSSNNWEENSISNLLASYLLTRRFSTKAMIRLCGR